MRADTRRFTDALYGEIECRICGARIKVLPFDARNGFCFDCLDHWNHNNLHKPYSKQSTCRLDKF
ncbi:MAG: hypothetical protein QW620_06570 [Thermoplasmata archaeon]